MENEMNWMDYSVYCGDSVKLYHGDCLEIMDLMIEDKTKVDMILCDLPYGSTNAKWDVIIPFNELWVRYEKIIKDNGVIVLTASQPFASKCILSKVELFKYCWYWDRCIKSNFLNAKHQPIRHIEEIIVFYKKKPTYNPQLKDKRKDQIRWNNIPSKQQQTDTLGKVGYLKNRFERRDIPLDKDYPTEFLQFSLPSANKGRNHPTEKPVELMEYLIKTYTNEGETVLDNCIGSGTTAVACQNTGRECIGIEKDKKYFDLATKRLNDIWSDKLNKQVNELF